MSSNAELFRIVTVTLGDITQQQVDAIVNAAHCDLLGGGGVDGAIHNAAGPQLLDDCRQIGGCPAGEARITNAFALPCRFVIHAVPPIYSGGGFAEFAVLKRCYLNSMALAVANGCRTIAFPALGCGHNAFPEDIAASIAMQSIRLFLEEPQAEFEEVRFVCRPEDFTESAFSIALKKVFCR